MKTCLILFLVGTLTNISLKLTAQNCATVDKKDAFTNAHIIETSEVKVFGAPLDVQNKGIFLSFQLKNDTTYVCLNVSGELMNTYSFATVLFKFRDNTILTLKDFFTTGVYELGDDQSEKSYSAIDKQSLSKLATAVITDIRFVTSNDKKIIKNTDNALIAAHNRLSAVAETEDSSLSSGKASKVMKEASCILLYLR